MADSDDVDGETSFDGFPRALKTKTDVIGWVPLAAGGSWPAAVDSTTCSFRGSESLHRGEEASTTTLPTRSSKTWPFMSLNLRWASVAASKVLIDAAFVIGSRLSSSSPVSREDCDLSCFVTGHKKGQFLWRSRWCFPLGYLPSLQPFQRL